MHEESPTVTVPTATTVMRRGYQLRDRLLRPAMVGVTDPAAPTETPAATDSPSVDETSDSASEV
jgi:molecular chaperone GrpE